MPARLSIIKALTRTKPKISSEVELDKLTSDARFDNLSGADIASVVREASMHAMRTELKKCLAQNKHILQALNNDNNTTQTEQETTTTPEPVKTELTVDNFEFALSRVKPSISEKDRASYENLRTKCCDTI